MNLTKQLNIPGEHPLTLKGHKGDIEAVLTVPPEVRKGYIAILGHPHSLQGGTMNNKVVTTMARAFKDLNLPSLRFNFRGVGNSAGVYDSGLGESEDMLLIAEQWEKENSEPHFLFAGFSFGSYVAYRAAAQCAHALLITIAPPIHHYDYHEFVPPPNPWLIFQGDKDEVVPADRVFEFAINSAPCLPVVRFSEAGHFFHGRLLDLRSELIRAIQPFY